MVITGFLALWMMEAYTYIYYEKAHAVEDLDVGLYVVAVFVGVDDELGHVGGQAGDEACVPDHLGVVVQAADLPQVLFTSCSAQEWWMRQNLAPRRTEAFTSSSASFRPWGVSSMFR